MPKTRHLFRRQGKLVPALPRWLLMGCLSFMAVACFSVQVGELGRGPRHGWWDGLGAVLPHESFPADCSTCHLPQDWSTLQPEFAYDHLAETGVPLEGRHAEAQCLRCHNDRAPIEVLSNMSCASCHEDVHFGQLGADCTRCHDESSWLPSGQLLNHAHSRFPLVGIHAATDCRRCHIGAEVGNFTPVDNECISCHGDDLARANNPNHIALGWVNRCDSCHVPLSWNAAELDPNFSAASSATSPGPQPGRLSAFLKSLPVGRR